MGQVEMPEAPKVLVFDEADRGGAAWVGGIGYSDGTPELCTPVDADVTNGAGAAIPVSLSDAKKTLVVRRLLEELRRFAWTGHSVPTHRAFREYVHDVLKTASGPDVELLLATQVEEVSPAANGWTIVAGGVRHAARGVVITGPGRHRRPIAGTASVTKRVTDAREYWRPTRRARVTLAESWLRAAADEGSPHVVIAGTGGAAPRSPRPVRGVRRSLEEDRARRRRRRPQLADHVRSSSCRPAHARREHLGDACPSRRRSVGPPLGDLRKEANDHLVSGVVFRRVLEGLERWVRPDAPTPVSIDVDPGRVLLLDDGADASWDLPETASPLRVVVRRDVGGLVVHGAHYFVNAIGFDARWFLEKDGVLKPDGLAETLKAIDLQEVLDSALAVELHAQLGDGSPPSALGPLRHLHLPMFAGGRQPPGFGSLLNLGGLAERIMTRYF
jgi:hypothetical protein